MKVRFGQAINELQVDAGPFRRALREVARKTRAWAASQKAAQEADMARLQMDPGTEALLERREIERRQRRFSPRDIMYLAAINQRVAYFVQHWKQGRLSWEQMLVALVLELNDQNARLERNATRELQEAPRPMLQPGLPVCYDPDRREVVKLDGTRVGMVGLRALPPAVAVNYLPGQEPPAHGQPMTADEFRTTMRPGFDRRTTESGRYQISFMIQTVTEKLVFRIERSDCRGGLTKSEVLEQIERGLRRCLPDVSYHISFGFGPTDETFRAMQADQQSNLPEWLVDYDTGRITAIPAEPAPHKRGMLVDLPPGFPADEPRPLNTLPSFQLGQAMARRVDQAILDVFNEATAEEGRRTQEPGKIPAEESMRPIGSDPNAVVRIDYSPADCPECHGTKFYNCPIKGEQPCSLCCTAPV